MTGSWPSCGARRRVSFAVRRWSLGIRPTYNVVDTCAGEFPAATPYFYSSYEDETESEPSGGEKIVILGSGPNRIGQGIEFDYCCVQAVLGLREAGYETIMVNSNPETVSTDFDVSDKLYFEPLTLEDVLEIIHLEKPKGIIVQLGGQTPLKLAEALGRMGATILGTSVDAIDRAEDRERFAEVCRVVGAVVPDNGVATSEDKALEVARKIGYPVLVRPSYVLGGRAMEIVYDEASLQGYFERAVRASPDHPVLIDRFIEDAFEADVDALSDGIDVVIGGHHAAHRGCWRPFRGFRLRSPPVPPGGGGAGCDAGGDQEVRHGAGRGGPGQCPVRHP